MLRVHCAVSETTHQSPRNNRRSAHHPHHEDSATPPPHRGGWCLFHNVTAVIAEGKRPVPSRTRKLSPPAPMVLHPPGCGRVGHRRTTTPKKGDPPPGPLFCVPQTTHPQVLRSCSNRSVYAARVCASMMSPAPMALSKSVRPHHDDRISCSSCSRSWAPVVSSVARYTAPR